MKKNSSKKIVILLGSALMVAGLAFAVYIGGFVQNNQNTTPTNVSADQDNGQNIRYNSESGYSFIYNDKEWIIEGEQRGYDVKLISTISDDEFIVFVEDTKSNDIEKIIDSEINNLKKVVGDLRVQKQDSMVITGVRLYKIDYDITYNSGEKTLQNQYIALYNNKIYKFNFINTKQNQTNFEKLIQTLIFSR